MKKKNKIKIIAILSIFVALAFLIFLFFNIKDSNLNLLITSIFIVIMSILLTIPLKESITSNFIGLLAIGLTCFNAYTFAKPTNNSTIVIENLQNKSLKEVIEYCNSNNIKLIEKYDYSDFVPKYYIINQSNIGSNIDDIKEIEFLISKGPNYNVDVFLPSFVGDKIDTLKEYINSNYLNNVEIKFIDDDTEANTIISQSLNGNIKRNDRITFTVSKPSFQEINMIELYNMSLFDAKLWLEMNAINYKLEYDYNDIDRDYIYKQSIDSGSNITENDEVIIYVSKGKSITVPNLVEMSKNDITKWITDNNLNVEYIEEYNKNYDIGKIISSNYKENDIIEQGTNIVITISKGSLKMIKFTNLSEFKLWASENNVKYEINYAFSDTVVKGNLVNSSLSEDDIIVDDTVIILTISNGKAITVPNFKGMKKTDISNKCKNLGLNCTFSYYGYTVSTEKDIAMTQSINASKKVTNGTYVNISLSSGIAKSFTVAINETDLVINNAAKTIESLTKLFSSKYPGVTFKFVTKASNTYNNAGFIHENSAVKNGTVVVQGKTYTVTITN